MSDLLNSIDALQHALMVGAGACAGNLRGALGQRAERSLWRSLGVVARHAWALATYALFVGALFWRPAHCALVMSPLLLAAVASAALWLAVALLRNPKPRE